MTGNDALEKLYSHVDSVQTKLVSRLREAVAIESVSADVNRRENVVEMVMWVKKHLDRLGASTEVCQLRTPPGALVPLPPVLFGTLGKDPKKKTLLVYGHLDVQPAKKEDGWSTDPFKLTEKDGKLIGRGASDDKGPVVAWINALEAMQLVGMDIPINIKFVFEGMEESGSEGLEDLLVSRQKDFLSGVDFVCISDNYWLGTTKPCLTYGLRGICYFHAEVSRPSSDLHSGLHGGAVNEPLADLLWLMSQLIDTEGRPAIPGLQKLIRPLTDEERKLYDDIDFDVEHYKSSTGAVLYSQDKTEILMRRWRYPSLSLHGVQGAFSDPGDKTVIPSTVTGKFSVRIVPDMQPEAVNKLVINRLEELWKERKSKNVFKPQSTHGGKAWLSDRDGPNYQAAHRAVKKVYGVDPDYTREGGSIPITLTFQELTGVPVLLLPIGASDDNPHAQNEKIDIRNYIQGTKLLATYVTELGKL